MRTAWTRMFAAVAVILPTLVGCSRGAPQTDAGPGDAAGMSAIESAARAPSAGDASDAVDACALLSDEDVTPLIGVTVDGVSTAQGARTACMWENPDTYESVSIDIGAPGTAPNDVLPQIGEGLDVGYEPGPDGTRILMGAVEFAAGNRLNAVQVATPATMSQDQSIAAAMKLIDEIKPQIR